MGGQRSGTSDPYFSLEHNKALVGGARTSLVLDFDSGDIFQLNEAARSILELGEKGLRVSEAIACLKYEPREVKAFIRRLAGRGFLRLTSRRRFRKPVKAPAPRLNFIWIETTSRCNLRCLHCYADVQPWRTRDPSTTEIKRWVTQAARLGCREIQFTGGECLLRPDLKELLRHAKKRDFEVIEIFTNGTLLTEPFVRFLRSASIQVALSIYSYRAETHDAITGVKGSFEKTLNALKYLLAYGVKLRYSVIAMKQNERDLAGTVQLMSKLGIKGGLPDPVRPIGRGRLSTLWPPRYGKRLLITSPESFAADRETYERSMFWNNCWFGKAAITSTGDVLPCVFARDQIVGNLREKSLAKIVNRGLIELWKINKDCVEGCSDCEYRYLCIDCRPWAYGFTGNLLAKSPRCTYDPYKAKWIKRYSLS